MTRDEPRRLFGLARRVFTDLRRCLHDLVLCQVVFQVITFVLLAPATAWVLRLFLAAHGERAVGNLDVARFLLSPIGIVALLGLGAVALAIQFLGLAALMRIGYGAAVLRPVSWRQGVRFAFSRAGRVLAVSFLSVTGIAVVVTPFAVVAAFTVQSLLGEHNINFYLDTRPTELWVAVAISGVLGVAALVAVVFVGVTIVFSLPDALFRDAPARRAFAHSREMVKRRFFTLARPLLTWALIWIGVSLVVNALGYGLGHALIAIAGESVGALLTVLGLLAALSVIGTFLLAILGVAASSLLIVHLYRDTCADDGGEPPMLLAPEESHRWTRMGIRSLAIVAVAAAAIAMWLAFSLLQGARLEDRVDITAHRGSSIGAPENTIAAIELAITEGATVVEIDVQLTADGHVVVVHDADLMRVGGEPLVITETEFEDLRAVNVGDGQILPTLDEVIDIVKGRVLLDVEIKSYAADGRDLVKEVVAILHRREMVGGAVMMSLVYDEVMYAKEIAEGFRRGFVAAASIGDIGRLDADFLAVSEAQATNALIASAHSRGREVWVWTVDDPDAMSRLIDRGVDNVITNVPAEMVRVLQARAELGTAERILLRFRNLYGK